MGTPYTLRDVKPKAKTTLPYLYPALNFSPSLAPPPPPLYLKLLHPPSSTPHLNLQLPHYHTFTLSQPWATPTLISWLSTPFDSSLSMLPSSRSTEIDSFFPTATHACFNMLSSISLDISSQWTILRLSDRLIVLPLVIQKPTILMALRSLLVPWVRVSPTPSDWPLLSTTQLGSSISQDSSFSITTHTPF